MRPEAVIERDNASYAENVLGLVTLKLRLIGAIGWPDRLFGAPGGRLLFIEYKATGEEPTPKQRDIHKLLIRYGFDVYTVDNINEGRELLRRFTERKDLPKNGSEIRLGFFEKEDSRVKRAGTLKKRKYPEADPPPRNTELGCQKHTTGGGPCYCSRGSRRSN